MPNWCFSNVEIRASEESIAILERELEKALSSNPAQADFGDHWLGNLLLHIGVPEAEVRHGAVRCRGSVISYLSTPCTIMMDIESAWVPHIQCIKAFCDYFADDAEISYFADEPGCELFWTNDPEMEGTAYIDQYDLEEEEDLWEFCDALNGCNKKTILAELKDLLGHDGSIEQLVNEFEEIADEKGGFASIHFYEYVPIGPDT